MEDEIKEILDKLKKLCYDDYCLEFSVDYIERKEEKLLLDYITNLQEENENLKDFNNKLQATKDRLDKYDKENTMLIEDYKSRCEKSIEYVKNNTYKYRHDIDFVSIELTKSSTKFINDLLDILQGSDKE